MTRRSRLPPSRLSVFFTLVFFLQFLGGLAGEPSTSNNEVKSKGHGASGGVGVKVLLVCFGVVAVVAFCVFLFKRWQKKKREEQHARLLRLFEEDDELELELGLRD
ncbi:unnamed protein product [Victoria cruziana]